MTQVRAEPRSEPRIRCAFCHADADPQAQAPCAGCGTVLHPECRVQARGCPTLGCRFQLRAAIEEHTVEHESLDLARAVRWLAIVGLVGGFFSMFVGFIGLAAGGTANLFGGIAGFVGGATLTAGSLITLGLLTLRPRE